jgi:hypothetical protein
LVIVAIFPIAGVRRLPAVPARRLRSVKAAHFDRCPDRLIAEDFKSYLARC